MFRSSLTHILTEGCVVSLFCVCMRAANQFLWPHLCEWVTVWVLQVIQLFFKYLFPFCLTEEWNSYLFLQHYICISWCGNPLVFSSSSITTKKEMNNTWIHSYFPISSVSSQLQARVYALSLVWWINLSSTNTYTQKAEGGWHFWTLFLIFYESFVLWTLKYNSSKMWASFSF